jgi:hypothetical protein
MPRNREEADLFFCSVTPLQNVRNENLEPGQLPHKQHGLSALHAQPTPTDSFPDPVEVQLPRSSAQVSERNAQAIAPDITQAARVQSLIDQIQTLLKAGRHRACASLAGELEVLLRSLPRRGTQVKDGWIMLARLEDHRLHLAKQNDQEIDLNRLRSLYKEAENVID